MPQLIVLISAIALAWSPVLWAGEAGPFVIHPVVFTTPSVVMSKVVHGTVMKFCPTGFDDPAQELTYTVEQCTIQETECQPMFSGKKFGGPLVDIRGNPISCVPVYTIPRMRGKPSRVRMVGQYIGAGPMEISFIFEPN